MRKSNVSLLVLTAAMSLSLVACQGDDRLQEVSNVQSEAQLQKEKVFREAQTSALEDDLAKRKVFYFGVGGNYEGTIKTTESEYKIRIRLMPILKNYKPDGRIRFPEEVVSDINSMSITAQIVQWSSSGIGTAFCKVVGIQPDLIDGSISIASEECPSFYKIYIHNGPAIAGADMQTLSEQARILASTLMDGRPEPVTSIAGEAYPTSPTRAFQLTADRKE